MPKAIDEGSGTDDANPIVIDSRLSLSLEVPNVVWVSKSPSMALTTDPTE